MVEIWNTRAEYRQAHLQAKVFMLEFCAVYDSAEGFSVFTRVMESTATAFTG